MIFVQETGIMCTTGSVLVKFRRLLESASENQEEITRPNSGHLRIQSFNHLDAAMERFYVTNKGLVALNNML